MHFVDGSFGVFGWIMMIIMMVVGLLFLVLLVVGLVYLIRYLGVSTAAKPLKEGSLEIAKKRYAKGEITKQEYEEIKKSLM
jgi:putative membrane protein